MWFDTAASHRLGITFPIIQGPFGGGLSSVRLAAVVSDAGGLGSFGLQGMSPSAIKDTIADLRRATSRPFAVNLWVSVEDEGARTVDAASLERALRPLRPFYERVGLRTPSAISGGWPTFEEQARAVIESAPPVLSFVFGVPPDWALDECRAKGIITIGTATTVDEALALERAGLDLIVASGFEAGGHRGSFLRSAEQSLTGTFSLVPQMVDAVRVPVIAAGGIADARGLAAAMLLGASGVQIGTAFLACDESNAPPLHKTALRSPAARTTMLTRALSGRLARGIRNELSRSYEGQAEVGPLPYPAQTELTIALRQRAIAMGDSEAISLWASQSASLLKHHSAAALFEELVTGTGRLLKQ